MQTLMTCLFLLSALSINAQINVEDSTVQTIGYWDKNETYSYVVTSEKYKVRDTDTTARERVKYDLDITVKDSTATSYTVEWVYKNFEVNSSNPLLKKLSAISENLHVLIKTDEFGAFEEVVNWEEVRSSMKKAFDVVRKDFKSIPKLDDILKPIEATFSTKQGIESNAMTDAQQYYTFHGGRYKLGEDVVAKIQLPNNFGGAPIDAELTVRLDEINPDDNNYILRYWQVADSKQVTDASYEFIKKVALAAGSKVPGRDQMPVATHEENVGARIHGTGWVIYSFRTKVVEVAGVSTIDEMVIEMK